MNIRILGIASIAFLVVFGIMGSIAVYNLFHWILLLPVAVVIGILIWQIVERMLEEEEYQRKLFWGDVKIVDQSLLDHNPRNVSDAQELIKVLKERLLDVDAARMEAVAKYNELLEELDEDATSTDARN